MGRSRWIGQVVEQLGPVLLVIGVTVAVIVAVRLLVAPEDPRRTRWTRTVALMGAIAVILVATLVDREPIGVRLDLKLIPFSDLISALGGSGSVRRAVIELVVNVALFVPLGLALRLRFESMSVARATAIACGLSLGIETLQLLVATGRVANITDVLMNTLGGFLGAILVREGRSVAGQGSSPTPR
jgi:glycopeptide antibiotics resistance protein